MRPQHATTLKIRSIILDRDGVINKDSGYVGAVEDWQPIKGSLAAMAALTQAGYRIFVVTNQSGIGRGYYTVEDYQAVNAHMCLAVEKAGGHIIQAYYCPHAPELNCDCRKPNTGMFTALAAQHQVDLTQSVFVGDKLSDLAAGDAIGAQSILVKTGCGEATLAQLPPEHGYPVYADLACFVSDLTS